MTQRKKVIRLGKPMFVLGRPTDVVLNPGSPYLRPYLLIATAKLLKECRRKGVLMFPHMRAAKSERRRMGAFTQAGPPHPDEGVMVQLDERTFHGTLRVVSRVRKIDTIYIV